MTADWLSRHSRSVVVAVIILIAAGVAAAIRLPVSLFPAIDFPRIAVNIDSGDRPAERMLTEVTIPVEEAVRSVPGVKSLRSRTSRGSAELSVTFEWDHDMVSALLQVQAATTRMSGKLPQGSEVVCRRMDPTVFPVLGYSLISDTITPVQLRDLAEHQVRATLSAVPGVAKVDVAGGAVEEVHIEIDPAALAARGVSQQDLAGALTGWNVIQATGRIEDRLKLYLVMVSTPVNSVADVENIRVHTSGGALVRLGDIARVSSGEAPNWTRVTADGRDAVLVQVYQQPGGNSVQIARAASSALESLKPSLPEGVRIANWYDQSQLVQSSATGLRDAVIIGAALAGLVLLIFLRNLRVTLIALITVPGVLASACLLLLVFRQSLNIMTLGGMAAAVGLIIDDAMVMVEHIVARIRDTGGAEQPRKRALLAAGEFSRPLLGASLATIVIHIPPAFLSGVTGEFFKALSLTIAVSLVVSFCIAWALVPILAGALLKEKDARVSDEGRFTRATHRVYGATVSRLLRWPWMAAIAAAALVVAGVLAYPRIETGFMPEMDEGGFVLDYRTPPGTALSETDRVLRQIEDIIRATPDVETYSRRTGLQLGGGITEVNEGDFFIRLKAAKGRRPIDEVMDEVRTKVEADVPGIEIELTQLMEDLIGDLTAVPQPIEVKLYSEDQNALNQVAPRVADAIAHIQGVEDINKGLNIAGDALEVHVDPVRAGLEGLDAAAVADQIEKLLSGTIPSQYQIFGDTPKVVGIRVWAPPHSRQIEGDLARMRLTAPDGHMLPLSRIAEIKRIAGQPQIQREDLRRLVAVTARISGTDLGSAIKRVQEAMRQPGLLTVEGAKGGGATNVSYALGGLYREQQTAFVGLLWVFGAAIVLLLLLLVYWYESLRVAVCLVLTALLALPGVALALWLTKTQLNIGSMMGLAMIAGSVVEAGVFLCSEVIDPVELPTDEPADPRARTRARITAAALRRIRPIAMTTIAAILAMTPLIIGLGEGSAMLRPLAVAIVAGLIVQLPLVLLVLPAMLAATRAVQKRITASQPRS